MNTLQINDVDRKLIENVITKIAKEQGIDDVISIDLEMTSEGSIVHFKQKEGAVITTALALMALGKLIYSMGRDPEIRDIAEKLVDLEIKQKGSMVRAQDKDKYIEMIIGIVTDGAEDIYKTLQTQQQKQPQQTTPTQAPVQQPSGGGGGIAPGTGLNASHNDPMKKTAGLLETVGQWGVEVSENINNAISDFFVGPSRNELIGRLVDVSARKGFIPNAYIEPFKTLLNQAIGKGLNKLQEAIAQQKQQQQGQQGQYPGNPKYERDANNQIKQYPRTDGGTAYRVTYDPSSGKKPIFVTAEPPHTLVPDNQIAQQGAGQPQAGQAGQTETTTTPQAEQQATQLGAQSAQPVANINASMIKEGVAIGAILKNIAKYAPELIVLARVIYDIWKKRKTAVEDFTEQQSEPEMGETIIQGMINTTLEIINKIKAGLESDFINDIMKALESWNLDVKTSRDKIIQILQAFIEVLETIRDEPYDANSENIIDAEYTIEANYLKVNSGTYNMRAGSAYYKEFEALLQKVAEQRGLDNISDIEMELTKETGEIVFRRKESADLLAGLGAAAVSYFFGGHSVSTALLHGLGGALTNLGFPVGMAVAKTMGFDAVGQGVGGLLASVAFSFLKGSDKENAKDEAGYQEYLLYKKKEAIFKKMVAQNKDFQKIKEGLMKSGYTESEAIRRTVETMKLTPEETETLASTT